MRKPPFWASVLTLCGLIILCSLGTWQLQRLAWKNDIIAKLEDAYNAPKAQPLAFKDFAYGRIEGRFMANKAFLFGVRMKDEQPGADLIVPVRTRQGDVLVDMGFASGDLKSQPIGHLNGKQVWFDGLARTPSSNAFTPENIPQENTWYKFDIAQIAKSKDLKNPAPVILYAERASHKFDAAFPNNERMAPNNNHLQYALFWYAMASVLFVIYVLRFIRK